MAISVKTVADKVYGLLKGFGFSVDIFDSAGEVTGDPAEALRFFVEDPNLLVTLNVEDNEIRLSVSENTEQTDKLREQLTNLAKTYLMTTDFRVFGKTLKPSSESTNIKKESKMEESGVMEGFGTMTGSVKTSYQPLDNVKIIVRHAKPVNEEVRGARSRNISKIFIQRGEERFAFPSKNLAGARAMARHIHNGGAMHDNIGESIVAMCGDLKTLREFVRYVQTNNLVTESNQEYVTLAFENIEEIRKTFKKLSGVKTYASAVESVTDHSSVELIQEVDLEQHFTQTHFDDKVANAVDTIKHLVNRRNAFESYIMSAISNESFGDLKDMIAESGVEFENQRSRLGYQVGQMSSVVKDQQLSRYLGSIGSKLSNGGTLDAMEYRAVKASLLSAQSPTSSPIAEDLAEGRTKEYEAFLNTFVTSD
jgi:hypothetical protein